MKRGDIVLVAASGDYGKSRPAVLVQSDTATIRDGSIILCLMTTDIDDVPILRLRIDPEPGNGLREPSTIMIDKIFTVPRAKARGPIGRLNAAQMTELDSRLSAVLGLATHTQIRLG